MAEERQVEAQEQTQNTVENSHRNETIEALGARLAAAYGSTTRAHGPPLLLERLDAYAQTITHAYHHFQKVSSDAITLTYTSEWVLDNYYIIQQAVRQVREDMPPGFYQRLPRLALPDGQEEFGNPRVYYLARDFLSHERLEVNTQRLQVLMEAFQEYAALTMGEIWALPVLLRFVLIEALAQALASTPGQDRNSALPSAPLPLDMSEDEIVASAVVNLRTISDEDWQSFFELVSLVERSLRQDPGGVYGQSDFETRDQSRKAVEALARRSGLDETVIAAAASTIAQQAAAEVGREGTSFDTYEPGHPLADRRAHVSYYLLDQGQEALEKKLNIRSGLGVRLRRAFARAAAPFYLASILLLTVLWIGLILWLLPLGWTASTALALLLLIPTLTASTSLVNWAATMVFPPRILSKLSFKEAIPAPFHTLVVIPSLLTSREEADSLVQELEMHFLRNPEPGIFFALLTDFGDSETETKEEDQALIKHALDAILKLNEKHANPQTPHRFFLFHRRRQWNPSEGKWMGWERKRGKLHELNLLLRGSNDHSFSALSGDTDDLREIRYVITLDSDTVLPRKGAARLIGAMAHPLNRALFDERTGQITAGYSILQPRMEISPESANRSLFTRIFAGDSGLDLYTLAVSDVYQDLFGEGIFVGKGIYDVDAFERSVAEHIPNNLLLSHDLLEGLMGRAGLVSDITLIEDYPPHYFIQILRQHRWIRGDWQLLPWLLQPGRFGLRLSAIDRWKIIDNLRRSLLAPMLVLVFVLGMLGLPGSPWLWTAVVLLTPGIPVLTSLARGAIQTITGEPIRSSFRPVQLSLARWLLAVVFLPYETLMSLDAASTSLYRMLVTRRNMLQWTTAQHTQQVFGHQDERSIVRSEMGYTFLMALVLSALVFIVRPASLLAAAPVLVLWMFAPFITRYIHRPVQKELHPLDESQERLMRMVMRRTWSFFEQYVGPEDHWLPPDHYQEVPVGAAAHRTSPTNIGMLLTSTLAAYDLGYVDQLGLASRLSATFGSLERLERYRGHFLNWYDTLTLQTLKPAYVSTVDSGNLAACLIVIAQACEGMPGVRLFRWQRWQGYLDTLSIIEDTISRLTRHEQFTQDGFEPAMETLNIIREQVLAARGQPERWYWLYQQVTGPLWRELSDNLLALIEHERGALDSAMLRSLQLSTQQVEQHHVAARRTIQELVPWIPLLEQPPKLMEEPGAPLRQQYEALREQMPYSPYLGKISEIKREVSNMLADLCAQVNAMAVNDESGEEALAWINQLEIALEVAAENAGNLLHGYRQTAAQANRYVAEMDFHFLYNSQRRVFHIGYNLDSALLDNSYYDLLASEARVASLIAIGRGDVPQQHWLHLNRPVTQVDGKRVLLSWSATMFEYLMPPLFLKNYPGTLLAESTYGAIEYQVRYARSKGVPWGISESGFYQFDTNQSYQYRAFGVPGLGFKRGLGDDLVIAPYASLMALPFAPRAVHQNTEDLIELGLLGTYGFYEAVDFTSDRLSIGKSYAIVREYMAHHQGMALLAMVNYFHDDIMIERMHADPRIRSVALLLQEHVPLAAPLQSPYAEDVKGVQRQPQPAVEIPPWSVPVLTAVPQVHLLSNGGYGVLITNNASGYSRWNDLDLTRWQPDAVLDNWGTWIYVQDLDSGASPWSAGQQPIPGSRDNMQVTFFGHMAVFRRVENGIQTTMEVTVPPEDPVEVRRLHLVNNSDQPRRLRLTSYGEVILAAQAGDARHPAFNKLFIQSEYIEAQNLLVFRRRPRSSKQKPVYAAHMLVLEGNQPLSRRFESDRRAFIGRGQDIQCPQALNDPGYLGGSSGATLDPIFALGQEIELPPHGTAQLAYLTFAGETREAILALAQRYQSWGQVEQAFHLADTANQTWLAKNNIDGQEVQAILRALTAMVYPVKEARAPAETLAANRLGQPGLWRFGISGDFPIMLIRIDGPQQIELVRQALEAHRYLSARKMKFDLVILNQQQTNYGAELNGLLYRLVMRMNSDRWLNQRGGIFILYADQMPPDERRLLETSARLLLDGEQGSFAEQMPGYATPVPHLPEFAPSRPPEPSADPRAAFSETDLQFHNGYGGFSADGHEYVIDLIPGKQTPAPWINVIGYPEFGFLVSEAGSSCTWAINSGENRLTPWSNDPVRDPSGEVLYLRDEESGEIWTPTPQPAGAEAAYRTRHGAGYTIFEHNSHGLRQHLTLFAVPDAPVKFIRLRLENTLDRPRRITATQYVEWVLGTTRAVTLPYIVPEYDAGRGCLLATNRYNMEFSEQVAFLAASKPIHGVTADRTEFIGRNGSLRRPAALGRIGLEMRVTPGEDPCGALQVHVDLPPGGAEEFYFLLGEAENRQAALDLVDAYRQPEQAAAAWENTRAFWERLLQTVQVRTPDPAIDVLLNQWLLYQALSCRIWGRSAFYQSSGAFGFRDQLQDVLSVLASEPEIAREQILRAAGHQFEAGDVLHWWHPPSGRGVRTRISDDLLWLPYVTAEYLRATGDWEILDVQIPYRTGLPLREEEEERYGEYPLSEKSFSLLDHCRRAVEQGATRGPQGLPLIGTGDWNDGMNQVGAEGRGESVWLAWFLYEVFDRFAWVLDERGEPETALRYRERAAALRDNIERHAWDGQWYHRAYYDDGDPLGSSESMECQIDSIAQSWAVLSGAGQPERARQAMQSVLEQLVRPDERLLLLFTPPFDETPHDPGYIKGYLPGIRENGGQYTHAATWAVWAFTRLGEGELAGSLYRLLNPVYQADTVEKADIYRVEPYVVAADIYSVEPYVRRGGWTWYTGSSGWMYRLGLEALLGFRREADRLVVDPVIPPGWDGFEIRYRAGETLYEIRVSNPNHVARGVKSIQVDGKMIDGTAIPLEEGGPAQRVVEIVLG